MTILLFAVVLAGDCVCVDGDQVLVGDLVARVPAMRHLPSDLRFGFAPSVGVRRTIAAHEMNAFLRKYQAAADVVDSICVERAAVPLDKRDLLQAIARAFQDRRVRVEIIEYSRRFVPVSGSIEFHLNDLPPLGRADVAVIWHGRHVDTAGKRTPVWVRVKLSEDVPAMVAVKDIGAGAAIQPDDIEVRMVTEFPRRGTGFSLSGDFSPSMRARRSLISGQRVEPAYLDPPVAVARGEAVTVEIQSDNMRLLVTGKAATSARAGQRVAVTTSMSKRTFQAIAKEKGHAIFELPPSRR